MSAIQSSRRSATRRSAIGACVVAIGALASGCNNAGQGAFTGAGVGALAGLVVGSVTGNPGAGAAIGAAGGAAVGGVIGDQNARRSHRHRDYYDRRYSESPSYYYERSAPPAYERYDRPHKRRHRDRCPPY